MRRPLALFGVVITAAVSLAVGVGTAAADSQPGGCQAYGQFMGTAASSSAHSQWPLGQTIRQLTPFDNALAFYKDYFCG
jgi:hypothetical protein